MELKKDYKHTEIGLIPENWKLIQFKDITELITCGVAATPQYVTEYYGKPFLSAQNVQNGKLEINNYRFIDKKLYEKLTKHNKPERGDILYTRVGAGIGEAALVDTDMDFAIYVSLTLIKTKKDMLNPFFLKQLLNSSKYKVMAKGGLLVGAGVQNLNVQVVKSFLIPCPSIKEQEAIANALSDADAYIELLEKLIAKKRMIKKSLLQELFTPKKNWKLFRLGDCATLKARIGWQGLTTAEYLVGGDYGLVTGTDFKNGKIDWDNCHYVKKDRYDQDRNIQIKENDILITKDGTIGKVALISFIPQPTTLNSGVFVLRPINNAFDQKCFYYLLSSSHFDKFLAQLAAGSTISHLYQKDFVHFKFKLPDPREQIEIGSILFDVDCDIEHFEKKLKKAYHLKQGMMQELLTGRIRLL